MRGDLHVHTDWSDGRATLEEMVRSAEEAGLEYIAAETRFRGGSIHSGFTQSRDQIMQRLLSAVENPFVRAIGHPTGRLLGRREAYEIDLETLAHDAAGFGLLSYGVDEARRGWLTPRDVRNTAGLDEFLTRATRKKDTRQRG